MKDHFKNNYMGKPIETGFENYSLIELDSMLRKVLKYAVPQDKAFIKELAFEIDRRKETMIRKGEIK